MTCLIEQVHLDYLEAGANIIISASYQVNFVLKYTEKQHEVIKKPRKKCVVSEQATIQGFEAKGLTREESEALLRRSVEITCEARDIYLGDVENGRLQNRQPVLVAASVGSYGAYLADGSEYRSVFFGIAKLRFRL